MIPDERDAEEHQPGERKKDADHLAGCLRAAAAPGKEGENADAPGGRRLNERQGRDRESGDVQDPAAETGDEADEPGEVREQQPQGAHGSRDRERRHGRSGAVLSVIPDVERDRGGERQSEAERDHRRPPKGRYDSADSAANPDVRFHTGVSAGSAPRTPRVGGRRAARSPVVERLLPSDGHVGPHRARSRQPRRQRACKRPLADPECSTKLARAVDRLLHRLRRRAVPEGESHSPSGAARRGDPARLPRLPGRAHPRPVEDARAAVARDGSVARRQRRLGRSPAGECR